MIFDQFCMRNFGEFFMEIRKKYINYFGKINLEYQSRQLYVVES